MIKNLSFSHAPYEAFFSFVGLVRSLGCTITGYKRSRNACDGTIPLPSNPCLPCFLSCLHPFWVFINTSGHESNQFISQDKYFANMFESINAAILTGFSEKGAPA